MSTVVDEASPIVSVRDLTRSFPPDVIALNGATFDLPRSGSTAIVGASGSGKSTLLAILGLLDNPTHGAYLLDGRDTAALPDHQRTKLRRDNLSFIFQAFHLVPHLTATENVEEALRIDGTPPPARQERAAAALDAVGLAARASERPGTLSGGEQQRVAVARAIVREPRLLLCDEPTGNLDSRNAERVLDTILSAGAHECAVVIVTHDAGIAAQCDFELHVADGQVTRTR